MQDTIPTSPSNSSRGSTDMNHRRYYSPQRPPFLRRPITTKRFTIMYPRNTDQHSVFTLASPSATWLFSMRGSIVNRKVLCLARYSSCQFQLAMKSYLFYLWSESTLADHVQHSISCDLPFAPLLKSTQCQFHSSGHSTSILTSEWFTNDLRMTSL